MAIEQDCPICLESQSVSDDLFSLPCHKCEYNFCTKCVETFERSSKDDFQEASDGSRQVKVHLACPQCRGKYPMNISGIVLLRRAHSLGLSLVTENGERLADSELNATQLTLKSDLLSYTKKREVEFAYGLYVKVMKDGNRNFSVESTAEAMRVFEILFHDVTEKDDEGGEDEENSTQSVMKPASIDETLFQGLEECMGRDEKVFLTQLLTSGKSEKLHQAAMILNGILKLSMSGHTLASKESNDSFENKQYIQKAEQISKAKKQFPVPNHMPGYFLVPVFDKKQKNLLLKDGNWNGEMVPPAKSKRVFETIYENHYHVNAESRSVVLVKAVRGPVGRLGLRRGDVVTHVNDIEWAGTAEELHSHLHQHFIQNPSDVISVTVNANRETAKFLKIRGGLIERSKQELL